MFWLEAEWMADGLAGLSRAPQADVEEIAEDYQTGRSSIRNAHRAAMVRFVPLDSDLSAFRPLGGSGRDE